MLVEDLQLALAHDKALVAASSEALATSVARDLEVPISGIVSSARNMGIDVNSGKRRRKLCLVRRSRLHKAKRRLRRTGLRSTQHPALFWAS